MTAKTRRSLPSWRLWVSQRRGTTDQPRPGKQELAYWVEWMVAQRQAVTIWQGRLEGLVGRHWPEATQVLKLSSVTLLRALKHYGCPQALAADPQAAQQLAHWGGKFLELKKVKQVVENAGSSVGVRAAEWQRRQIQDYAQQALAARAEGQRAERQLRRLAAGHAVLQAQGKVVGVPTACVLWTSTGDPRKYHAAAAYRKAMGLNLVERSSGQYKGRLRISKRGSARSRQWLYFAVLRLIQRSGVRPWYEAKKARNEDDARIAVVAVMRKLAMALYHVGIDNQEFKPRRLFGRIGKQSRQLDGATVSNEDQAQSGERTSLRSPGATPERIARDGRRHDCWAGATANLDCRGVRGR